MQLVSFVYRTKRTRSLLSFFFSHSHLISLCIIPNRWQSFVFISHDFLGGHCSIVGLVENGLQ